MPNTSTQHAEAVELVAALATLYHWSLGEILGIPVTLAIELACAVPRPRVPHAPGQKLDTEFDVEEAFKKAWGDT